MIQGELGNCWLVAACSTLAANKDNWHRVSRYLLLLVVLLLVLLLVASLVVLLAVLLLVLLLVVSLAVLGSHLADLNQLLL